MNANSKLFAIKPLDWPLDDSHWPRLLDVPMVFIERYCIPAEGPDLLGRFRGRTLYLFGGPVPVAENNAFRVYYRVVEHPPADFAPIEHELSQGGDNVFWCSRAEQVTPRPPRLQPRDLREVVSPDFRLLVDANASANAIVGVFSLPDHFGNLIVDEYIDAGRPKNPRKWMKGALSSRFPWIGRKPRWVEGEGDWPFLGVQPMVFLAQTAIPENDVTDRRIGYDDMLYVFAAATGDAAEIKIYRQSIGEQTAAQHYALEELIGEFTRWPRKIEVIRRCVEEGDKYMHEFMLEQKDLSESALKLLSIQGSNAAIRAAAAKRLKGGV